MSQQEIRTEFVEANGLRFEVNMCGEGDKLALCLHGFPEHAYSWRYQLPLLAELGYTAWAPNLRGYGKSSRPPYMEDYSVENLMEDVGGLVDASGCKSVVLIAHDWGAVVAWLFAIRKIRPLEKLIIMNVPHPGPASKAMKSGFTQLRKSWYIFFFQIPWLPEFLFGLNNAKGIGDAIRNSSEDESRFPEEDLQVYRDNANQPGALTAMINWYRGLLRGGGAKRQADLGYPVIEVPTLMVWGEEDVALSKATTYGTEEYVSDFRIRYLPRVSHWVQQEAPEAVNAMVEAFLKEEPIPYASWEMKLSMEEPVA
jgi:pimeloyl-ACP methyl ester carboxylesterase